MKANVKRAKRSHLGGHGLNTRVNKDVPVFRERFRDRLKDIDMSQREMADALGKDYRTVFNYIHGPNHPDLQTLLNMSKVTGTSLDWFFGLTSEPKLGKARFNQDDYALLKVLSCFPSAGRDSKELDLDAHVLTRQAVHRSLAPGDESDYVMLAVEDDSMEPTIQVDSRCIIDTSKTHPVTGGIFAMANGNVIYLRRLVVNPVDKKAVLKADNPAYQPMEILLSSLRLIGRATSACGKL